MARRHITEEERISSIDQFINQLKERQAKIQDKIDGLEAQKQNILDHKKEEKILELMKQIEATGMTVEEVLAKVNIKTTK